MTKKKPQHKATQTHLNCQHFFFSFSTRCLLSSCMYKYMLIGCVTKIFSWFLFLCRHVALIILCSFVNSSLMAAVAVTQSDFVFVHHCQPARHRWSNVSLPSKWGLGYYLKVFNFFTVHLYKQKMLPLSPKKLSQVRFSLWNNLWPFLTKGLLDSIAIPLFKNNIRW